MSVELVTGYAGASHVGADEVRKLIRSLAGTGDYYCETAPTVTMTDANTCHITSHYAVCGGGLFRIEASDVTITTGAQGVKRRTFVALEYDKDTSTGVESAKLVAIDGTAGTTASDPTLTTGDLVTGCTKAQFALASIDLDGITVGTPKLLLERLPALDSDVVLFDVPVTSAVTTATLSDSLANYRSVDISYVSGAGVVSNITVYDPDGKSVNLSINEIRDSVWYCYGSNKSLSGNKIGAISNCDGAAFSNGNGAGLTIKLEFFVKIFKVVGHGKKS